MFKEEIKKLSPYDIYIISYNDLKDLYPFANGAYERGYIKIVFENTEHTQYYLNNIETYRRKLENELDVVKMFRDDVDVTSLDAYYKKDFNSHNDLFNNSQKLLEKMDRFLSQYNKNCNV